LVARGGGAVVMVDLAEGNACSRCVCVLLIVRLQGFYRSEVNCIMFTRADFFCAVCKRTIGRVIDSYTK
jgi:IgA peptidase M64